MSSELRSAMLDTELHHAALELALLEIRRLLDANPALTGAEIVAALEARSNESRSVRS